MSTSDTELDYLSPDFDPSSVTVPRLREILVARDVHYPASAKKPQLIEIFNENIVPQARKILSAHKRIKRTSKGITDIPSSQEGTVTGDDDAGLMPPPPVPSSVTATPRRKPGRKSTRLPLTGSEESAEDGPAPSPSPTKKTPGRRSSSKHARASDTEPGIEAESKRPPTRRTRKSEVAVDLKLGDPESVAKSEVGDESAFSLDNPFQSGSSPVEGTVRSPSGERKRKSLGASAANKGTLKRKGSANRRKTDIFPSVKAEDGIVVPRSAKFEIPIPRLTRKFKYEREADEADTILVGEEFTPEERLELVKEREANGQPAVEPHPPRPRRTGGISKSAPWVVLLTLLGGYATWWRREKLEIGYCGVSRHSSVTSNAQIPDWAGMLVPECEPCPQHAFCHPFLVTTCELDFVLKPHPLSLGGLVPLPPTCEPDGEKVRKVKQVADKAVEELRDRRAKWECGGLTDSEGKVAALEVDELELKKEVSKKKRKGMSEVEFEELWSGALGEIVGREEVISGIDGPTGFRTLASTSLARLPLTCALKRSARLTLARHRVELASLTLFISILAAVSHYLSSLRATNSQVPSLVSLTLDRLSLQATLHSQDPRAAPEPWISVGQLRDDVLRDEFSAKRRERLWKRVQGVVEVNANVRASVREGKHGEISRVWEWIGATGGLEDVLSEGGRRTSKRYSLGVGAGSSPVGGGVKGGSKAAGLTWQEGMPLY